MTQIWRSGFSQANKAWWRQRRHCTLLHCKHNNTKPRLRNGWDKRQQFLYDHDLRYSSVLTDTVGDLSLWVVQQLAVCKSLVKTWQCEQYASLYEMCDLIYLRHLFEGTMGMYSLLYAIQLNAWQFCMCFVQMHMLKFSCSRISLRVVKVWPQLELNQLWHYMINQPIDDTWGKMGILIFNQQICQVTLVYVC